VSDRPRVPAPLSEAATPRCSSASERNAAARAAARAPLPPPCLPVSSHHQLPSATEAAATPPSSQSSASSPPTSAALLAKPPQRSSSTCTVPSPPTIAGKVPKPPLCSASSPAASEQAVTMGAPLELGTGARSTGPLGCKPAGPRSSPAQRGSGPHTGSVCQRAHRVHEPLPRVVLVGLRPGFGPWPFFLFF
jgi:hypothetical protein